MNEVESSSHLSRRTTPTWEVELLISGVAVFAMLQLPGWLDDRVFALEPRLSDDWRLVLMLFYIYSKSAAIVLAVTFALHLFLRALWIALVGMHSVYPQGILMDRLRMGPIQRRIEESRHDTTSDAIERADNRASVVFAIGVSIAQIIVAVCVVFCGTLLVATFLTNALGLQVDTFALMGGAFALFMVPYAIVTWIDQASAKRPTGPAASRTIERILRFYTWAGMGRRNNHIIAILTSNGGERRMMAVVVGVMMATLIGVSTTYFAMRSGIPLGSYSMFPDSTRRAVDPAHYDDQRDPARAGAAPYVQSAIVTGPYLKLVVPFRPARDEPAMRKRCAAQLGAPDDDEALATARLSCLQSLHPVTLDGEAVADLRYEIASDPRTDRPALLAMIDVRDLPRGRHELRIARPLRADRARKKDDRDPGFDAIPFWR